MDIVKVICLCPITGKLVTVLPVKKRVKWQVVIRFSPRETTLWYRAAQTRDGQEKLAKFKIAVPELHTYHGVEFLFRLSPKATFSCAKEAGRFMVWRARAAFTAVFSNSSP